MLQNLSSPQGCDLNTNPQHGYLRNTNRVATENTTGPKLGFPEMVVVNCKAGNSLSKFQGNRSVSEFFFEPFGQIYCSTFFSMHLKINLSTKIISNIVDTQYQKLIYHQNTPALVTSNIHHHYYIPVNVENPHIYLCDSN